MIENDKRVHWRPKLYIFWAHYYKNAKLFLFFFSRSLCLHARVTLPYKQQQVSLISLAEALNLFVVFPPDRFQSCLVSRPWHPFLRSPSFLNQKVIFCFCFFFSSNSPTFLWRSLTMFLFQWVCESYKIEMISILFCVCVWVGVGMMLWSLL